MEDPEGEEHRAGAEEQAPRRAATFDHGLGLAKAALAPMKAPTTRTAAAKSAKRSMYEHSTIAPLTDFVDDDEMRTTKGDDPDTDRSGGPWAAP
ncbi:hypothetical protein [Janibacter hoylei]|uniref:hypothetical protein n=1 Tax=Janibacter hoylei TaxID=364298 RepID=UPI0027B88F09|nr:hypothetical protein [Janibacter hoylei]